MRVAELVRIKSMGARRIFIQRLRLVREAFRVYSRVDADGTVCRFGSKNRAVPEQASEECLCQLQGTPEPFTCHC